MEFSKENFNFQSLRKTIAILLPCMLLKDWLTKRKTSKIIDFSYFWAIMGKHLVITSFNYAISSYCDLQFLIRCFYNHCVLLLNVFLVQNRKKALLKCQFVCFFTKLDLIWNSFCPKDHTQLGDSININNLCCNPTARKKKIGKAIKRWAFLSLIYTIKGWLWATPQIKNIFFSINKKRRSSAFRNFFIKTSYVLAELRNYVFYPTVWIIISYSLNKLKSHLFL